MGKQVSDRGNEGSRTGGEESAATVGAKKKKERGTMRMEGVVYLGKAVKQRGRQLRAPPSLEGIQESAGWGGLNDLSAQYAGKRPCKGKEPLRSTGGKKEMQIRGTL